jgi:hypothetical protein
MTMQKSKRLFGATLAGCLVLVGCAGQQPTTPVVKYQNTIIAPPKNYLADCDEYAPPEPKIYMSVPWNGDGGKEDLLSKSLSANYGNLNACNVRLAKLRDWVASQLQLYGTDTTARFVGQQPTVIGTTGVPPSFAKSILGGVPFK